MLPGDVYVLNDPYHGGTHLPDVTVVTPVYLESQGERDLPTFYVGSRGHHADIGGTTPGSMPPFSTRIEEEGVQIDNVKLAPAGASLEAEMRALLQSGPHPSRNPEQNLADLKAQVAANEKGVRELRAMVAQYGLEVVQSYMRHVQDNAEESVRRVITKLKDGSFALPLDNGAGDQGRDPRRRRQPQRGDRLHRHLAAADEQLQRPTAVCMARCSMSFAPSSPTRSRSTPAA
jgi:5-oxoprolinase (ATP-hydrolysing)